MTVIDPGKLDWITRPHEPGEPARHVAEVSDDAGFTHVRGNFWRYEPGAAGRRHRHPTQEETFTAWRLWTGQLWEWNYPGVDLKSERFPLDDDWTEAWTPPEPGYVGIEARSPDHPRRLIDDACVPSVRTRVRHALAPLLVHRPAGH